MINLASNHLVIAEEICSRSKLSDSANTEVAAHHAGNGSAAKIIRLTQGAAPDRAQLRAVQRIEISLRHMMQHLNRPVKVPALSAMAGLSESSFFALFKMATGQTPLDFFIRARMQRAGELLAATTLQIKQVAAVLGYDDQFYFSRRFKSVHGISPREYRARKEEIKRQCLTPKPANKPATEEHGHAQLPRLVPAVGNPVNAPVRAGRLQPPTTRRKSFSANERELSSWLGQAYSVSVPVAKQQPTNSNENTPQ